MTIDKQELKALAQALADLEDQPELEVEHAEANDELWLHMHPHTILALLAEIERLEGRKRLCLHHDRETCLQCAWPLREQSEIDRLKAENEALRSGSAIKRMTCAEVREAFNQAYYQPREIGSDGEQCRAGVLAVIAAAVAKEASNG